jgi:hypothetical protein
MRWGRTKGTRLFLGYWVASPFLFPSLDIFWLKDDSLEDSANLEDPDVIAAEIVEDLRAALEEFELILGDLSS